MKFRKKPVVIDAIQFDPGSEHKTKLPHPVVATGGIGADNYNYDGFEFFIETLEGPMRVTPGDWIICGIKGEYYPCKPDIFEATYEPV